jgi:protein arginine N-methyltransferase 1
MEHHIPSIVDARTRLLKPGGQLIPARDHLFAAPVEHPARYRECEAPWRDNPFGFDLKAGREFVVNTWSRAHCRGEQLLAPGCRWATMDYAEIRDTGVAGEARWQAARAGTVHGLLVWFDAELAEGIGYSNAPGEPELVYGQAFFPLPEPVPVAAGDRIAARLGASLVAEDYVWRWDTTVSPADGKTPGAAFRQSTFHGSVRSPRSLARREAGHVPELGAAAEVDRAALELLDGKTALGDAAQVLAARFPSRFPRPVDALTHLADLAERYR